MIFGRRRHRNSIKMSPGMARVVLGFFALGFAVVSVGEWNKYSTLASKGKEAVATVVSYDPSYKYSKLGKTRHDWHVLAFDGMERRVELKKAHNPGETFKILYLPDNPSKACEGMKGLNAADLMGPGGFGAFIIFLVAAVAMGWLAIFGGAFFKQAVSTAGAEPAPAPPQPYFQPQQQAPAPAPAQGKYPQAVMNAAYSVRQAMLLDPSKFANAQPAESVKKMASSTDAEAAGAYELAKKIEFDASEEADNVVDGLYTKEQATANLAKMNPGFGAYVYLDILEKEIAKLKK